MRARAARLARKLGTYYAGWRSVVVLIGSAVIVAGFIVDRSSVWLAVGAIWILTLVLVGSGRESQRVEALVPVEVEGEPSSLPKVDGPLVTVVVTTFNEGLYLAHCLQSVQGQSHTRLECLVIDDASTDDSVTAAMETIDHDPRFRVIRNPQNVGLAASRNVGLGAASGTMVTFLDGDDFLYPGAIRERLAAFEGALDNGSLGGAFCNWELVPENAVPTDRPPSTSLRKNVTWLSAIQDNPFIASAPLILTETGRAVGGFNEGRTTAEDFDFWSRYLRHGYALRATQYTGIAYRQKRSSMYRSTILDHVDIQLDVYGFNHRSLRPEEVMPGTPFVFTEQPSSYIQALMRSRRLLVGVTVATHDGNRHAVDQLLKDFEASLQPWMLWAENWEGLIKSTSNRLEAYDREAAELRSTDLARKVQMRVLPLLVDCRPNGQTADPGM